MNGEGPEADKTAVQVAKWLKKLARESWQLELLVSAFTIFLLLQAVGGFSRLLESLPYTYDSTGSVAGFIFVFMWLVGLSIKALIVFLVLHLLLRGFWIGAIGLRSVQSSIDFSSFHYSEFFSGKLKRKIASLDSLVIRLDEICSIIFSSSFLFISMLLAFGLYLIFFSVSSIVLLSIQELMSGWVATSVAIFRGIWMVSLLLTGMIYLIDFFTLGFFKKFKKISRIYYPFYRFYSFITLAAISNSIYYYLIGKFSKSRIRMVFAIVGVALFANWIIDYDQFQYYSQGDGESVFSTNYYESLRPAEDFINRASIPSDVITGPYMRLFLRYDPSDNRKIKSNCPEFEPQKNEGINSRFKWRTNEGNIEISGQDFEEEDTDKLLSCLSSLYEVSVNDSVCGAIKYYFHQHPGTGQYGLLTQLPTQIFHNGENVLTVRKVFLNSDSMVVREDYAHIPFWRSR